MNKLLILAGTGWLLLNEADADLSLETETARLLQPGHVELSLAGEYQHSREGGELAVPLAFEAGLLPASSCSSKKPPTDR
jgi:3,4-dihydroxy-2-butanone 4-phosphate synthase